MYPSRDPRVDEFLSRYLGENDNRYTEQASPISEDSIIAVGSIVGTMVGRWLLDKTLDEIYDKVKVRFLKWLKANRKTSSVINLLGGDAATTILEFGNVRPAFHVQRGYLLTLSNCTIAISGSEKGMVKMDEAPSIDFRDVRVEKVPARRNFAVVNGRKVNVYTILRPLWIGDLAQDPYAHGVESPRD